MTVGASRAFMARYYTFNLLKSKLMRPFSLWRAHRSRDAWLELRERYGHTGTWLVVGNGPSLRTADLEALAVLPSIGSNKINLIYEQTSWRPTLYTIGDPILLFKLSPSHFEYFDEILVPHYALWLARTRRRKVAWSNVPLPQARAGKVELTGFRPRPWEALIDGSTITIQNIQLALWFGASRVLVIGCDHNYRGDQTSAKKVTHSEQNHFHPDYRKPGEVVNYAPFELMEQGYSEMARIARDLEVPVINITRRTALRAFPRASVEDILAEKG